MDKTDQKKNSKHRGKENLKYFSNISKPLISYYVMSAFKTPGKIIKQEPCN